MDLIHGSDPWMDVPYLCTITVPLPPPPVPPMPPFDQIFTIIFGSYVLIIGVLTCALVGVASRWCDIAADRSSTHNNPPPGAAPPPALCDQHSWEPFLLGLAAFGSVRSYIFDYTARRADRTALSSNIIKQHRVPAWPAGHPMESPHDLLVVPAQRASIHAP